MRGNKIIAIKWTGKFTDREIKEIDFARIYTDNFNHGTDGHNSKMVISKMANLLNAIHSTLINPALSDTDKTNKIKEMMGLEERE